jgi:multidrug efflux pump subunit AcrB
VRVISDSNRGQSSVSVEISEHYVVEDVLDEIKLQVDGVQSFPVDAERPLIQRQRARQEVMWLALYGNLNLKQLKEFGKEIHKEILDLPEVSVAELHGGPAFEISIEISKDRLREYQLSFDQVAEAVREFSNNSAAGQIRTDNGFISLRTENQAYTGEQFEKIPLINLIDGSQVSLGDVASIHDGFEQGIQYTRFNGKKAVVIFFGASSDQDIMRVADAVKNYIHAKQVLLPDEIKLESWVDLTFYLQGRLDIMLENMGYGALLVFTFSLSFLGDAGFACELFGDLYAAALKLDRCHY